MAGKYSKLSSERILLGARRYFWASWACVKFMTICPLLKPSSTNKFAQGVLGIHDGLSYRSDHIPSLPLSKAFPGIEKVPVQIGQLFPLEGSAINSFELVVLASIVKFSGAKRVFEIGTSHGVAAYNIAANLAEGGRLFTLDLPPVTDKNAVIETQFRVTNSDRKMIRSNRVQRRFLDSDVAHRVEQLYGDSATFDYSPYYGTMDLVFVDGSHAYDYVKSDTQHAMKLIRPGGIVVWHDYNDGYFWPDVAKYLQDFGRKVPLMRIAGTMFAVTVPKT